MTIQEFFKSKALKCILVLLIISLFSGGILSLANDLLSVSSEEKVARVISKLYSDPSVEATALTLNENEQTNEYGTVNVVYSLSDGNYIVNATGVNGYKSGTVTVWAVLIQSEGKINAIQAVSVDSYEKQTLMSQLSAKFLSAYAVDVNDGQLFFANAESDDSLIIENVVTGSTMSSRATDNAVNAALTYARTYLTGETKKEGGKAE